MASVEEALLEDPPSSRGSAVKGWLFWIGALLLFNLLSWLFEWPIFLF